MTAARSGETLPHVLSGYFELTLTGVTPGQPGLELTEPEFEPVVMPGIETQRLPDLGPARHGTTTGRRGPLPAAPPAPRSAGRQGRRPRAGRKMRMSMMSTCSAVTVASTPQPTVRVRC